jgi:hypothetical protein
VHAEGRGVQWELKTNSGNYMAILQWRKAAK